jgi:hypothetical protein
MRREIAFRDAADRTPGGFLYARLDKTERGRGRPARFHVGVTTARRSARCRATLTTNPNLFDHQRRRDTNGQ